MAALSNQANDEEIISNEQEEGRQTMLSYPSSKILIIIISMGRMPVGT
jgi:hypothetical protein